ncbi:MAG: hypothetical protein HY741_01680 [Chloroflexi bacterium]|nr:hypothetical protein [Chloroflexota bacterium]
MHCTQCGQALAADEQFCPACGAPREGTSMSFAQAEQEFFRLKGQLETRRLTSEQFENALHALMVQDAQGRYWMLGADSGVWYVYDGQQWVRATPAAPVGAPAGTPTSTARASSTTLVILAVLALFLIALLAVGGYWFLRSGLYANNPKSAMATLTPVSGLALSKTGAPLPTLAPVVTPTALPVIPTATLASDVIATSGRPTVPQETVLPTSARPTVPQETAPPPTVEPTTPQETVLPLITLPGSTVVVVIEPATATSPLPTEAPSLTPPPTVAATNTRRPPTRTPLPTATLAPTEVPTPAYPPGVYVTQMNTEPAEPKRNQGVTFLVTFLNTTSATQQYNWLIQIYDAESNRRFGETLVQGLTVPPGTSVQTSPNNWQVTGAGGCISFYAQAQFQNADGGRIPFTLPEGNAFSQGFTVCP